MQLLSIKELAKNISRNKVKRIPLLGQGGKNSLVDILYQGLVDDRFNSDEEVAQYFYPENPTFGQALRRLKSRLVQQLVNTIFFIDIKQTKFGERSEAYCNAYKELAAAQIMINRGLLRPATELLLTTLEQCQKYEFTNLIAEITRIIRYNASRTLNDQLKLEKYAKLSKEYEMKRSREILASDYYEDLIAYYSIKRSPEAVVHEQAFAYFEQLEPLLSEVDTSGFYFYTYTIGIIKYMSAGQYQQSLSIAEKAMDVLIERNNITRGQLLSVAIQKIVSQIQLRIFDEKEDAQFFKLCLELSPEGQYNWFKVLDLHFYHHIYTYRYTQALRIWVQATQHPGFSRLTGVTYEIWLLHAGYLHLLGLVGLLDRAEVEKTVGPFKYNRFINQFKAIGKDKEGMSIPLVLFSLIYNLMIGDSAEYGPSLEALEKYYQRYLDHEVNRRSAFFMRAMRHLTNSAFEPRANIKVQEYKKALDGIPPHIGSQSFAVEIIPYEDIWAMLMKDGTLAQIHKDAEYRKALIAAVDGLSDGREEK
jgi:hypothetical protein